MLYSNPEKKKQYMAQYNKKYYRANAEDIKPRAKANKKSLRQEKHDWLVSALGGACPHCNSTIWQYLRIRSLDESLLPMPVEDQSWDKIRTHTSNARLICTVCDLDLKRKTP